MNALNKLRNLSPAQRDALAARLRQRQSGQQGAAVGLPSIEPDVARRRAPFPLTEIQQAYWVGRQEGFELGNVAAHGYLEVDGVDVDVARLEAAFNRVIARHDMLRAVIRADGRQQILADVPYYRFTRHDLRSLTADERKASLETVRDTLSHQVLPTDRWPLFDLQVSLLPDQRIRLHMSLDVLIFDAHSFDEVISPEWAHYYQDPEAPLPPLSFSFADYVAGLELLEQSPGYASALAYWRRRLDTLPPGPEFPLARSPESIHQPTFSHRSLRLPREEWSALRALAGAQRVTPATALLSAYALVVGAWSQSPVFTLNLTLFNRYPFHPDVNRLVGDFTSVTLLEIDLRAFTGFGDFARAVQRQLWEDMDHRAVSGVRVLRELAEHQRGSRAMTVPVVFTGALGAELGSDTPAAMSWLGELAYLITQTPQVWLDCQAVEDGGDLILDWDSVDDLFEPGFIDAMFDGFGKLVRGLANEAEHWCKPRLDLLPDAQHALFATANATALPLPPGLLHEPLLERCRQTPTALAVADARRELSFGELYAESNALAHALLSAGLPRNALVAVLLPKSVDQVTAVLGILESGNAYLPIEPSLPPERIQDILTLSGARGIVSRADVLSTLTLPEGLPRFLLETLPVRSPQPIPSLAGPRDLAYVIYTSGSTGTPKGVAIDHRGARNTCLDCNLRFNVGPNDRVLGLSALNFDLSVWDIFGVMGAGGALILPDHERQREPAHWADCMDRYGVTIWNTVPALLDLYIGYRRDVAETQDNRLRLAMMSGDWIPLTLPAQIRAVCPRAELYSLGGATEGSIWSICYPIGLVDPAWRAIPYGTPMANQTFHVRDARLDPCPVGVPGELCIGGIGVAIGYWRDEARTAAQFVFCPHSGERLYRTGDLGRWLPDGTLELLGRMDFQVKLNGYRVELGEIEATMSAYPGVQTAVAHVTGEAGQPRQLIGYYLREGIAAEADQRKLEARLGQHGLRLLDAPLETLEALPPAAAPQRRSIRHFRSAPLTAAQLGQVLAGLRQAEDEGVPRYRYASAGGLYPVQVYVQVAADRVEGLAAGLYYYHPGSHALQCVAAGRQLDLACFPSPNQPVVEGAAFCLFLVGSRQAIEPHYGAEAVLPLCLLEAGAMSQLVEESAVAAGLGTVQLGGFLADRAGDCFGLGKDGVHLHVIAGGLPAPEPALAPTTRVPTDAEFEAGLREYLAGRLAEYMVPRQFVRINRLPLSANGKVDRKALPAPQTRRTLRTVTAAQVEQHPLAAPICALWQEVLGLDAVGLDDNFFDLGGTSVDMIRIHSRLQPQLPQPVPLIDMFFTYPTIGDFLRSLGSASTAGESAAASSAETAPERPRNRRARQRDRSSSVIH